jgi:hypothetical protein
LKSRVGMKFNLQSMQTHNIPQYSVLYWSSVYSKKSSKSLYFFRLITQIFTKSNLEHCGICQVIPQDIRKQIVEDTHGRTEIIPNNFYVFESNKTYGNVVESLEKRLNGLLNKKRNWSGTLFIQPLPQRDPAKNAINLTITAHDNIDNLKKPYTVQSAIFCALNNTIVGKWVYKKFNMKARVSKYNHCSASNFINIQNGLQQKIDRELAIQTSPEELCNYLIKNYNADAPQPLMKVENGFCLWYNSKYLKIV